MREAASIDAQEQLTRGIADLCAGAGLSDRIEKMAITSCDGDIEHFYSRPG